MHAGRLVKRIALFLIAALCLSACSGDAQLSPEDAKVVLPQPAQADRNMIIGSPGAALSREVSLHYASENSLSLDTVTREIRLEPNGDLIQSLVQELLVSANLSGSVEAKLLSTESGSGIVTVNLSIEAGVNRSEQDYMLLCSAIAATLLEIESVHAVNVLTGNRSDPLCGLPMGAFVESGENIAALYAQAQTEAQRFLSEGSGGITRNVLLYFPAEGGSFMLPEVRELKFESADYTSALLHALGAGPLMRSCCFGMIPKDVNLLDSEPELYVNDAGERILELNFSGMLTNYLAFAGIAEWQFCAGLVLTFCSFLPELDSVRICVDSAPVEEIHRNGSVLRFDDGIMRRADFADTIGGSAVIHFANGENAIARQEIPLSRAASVSPLSILRAMVEAEAQTPGLTSVFPASVTAGDILGVSLDNGTATVNLSADFYAACQSMNAMQERQLVYAMVNTLAGLDGIGNVAFVVEGMQSETLAREIYLRTPLIPDPGLVQPVTTENGMESPS